MALQLDWIYCGFAVGLDLLWLCSWIGFIVALQLDWIGFIMALQSDLLWLCSWCGHIRFFDVTFVNKIIPKLTIKIMQSFNFTGKSPKKNKIKTFSATRVFKSRNKKRKHSVCVASYC